MGALTTPSLFFYSKGQQLQVSYQSMGELFDRYKTTEGWLEIQVVPDNPLWLKHYFYNRIIIKIQKCMAMQPSPLKKLDLDLKKSKKHKNKFFWNSAKTNHNQPQTPSKLELVS